MSLESITFSKELLGDVPPSSLPASCLFCFCSCSSSCLSFSSSFFRTSASSYLVGKRSQDVFYWHDMKNKEFHFHKISTLLWGILWQQTSFLQLKFYLPVFCSKPQLINLPSVDFQLPKNLEKRNTMLLS